MTTSSHARHDGLDGLDLNLRRYLNEKYLLTLTNLDKINPKMLVVFSGGNGVGKSTLARKINAKFEAILIENDAVKRQLLNLNPAYTMSEMSPITWKYIMELYERLASLTPNGLVVRDGTIAWYFDRILPVFEKQGYELFVIDYDLSEQKMIELVKARGNTPTTSAEPLLTILTEHINHMSNFRKQFKADVVLTDDTVFNHDTVLDALDLRLKSLKN